MDRPARAVGAAAVVVLAALVTTAALIGLDSIGSGGVGDNEQDAIVPEAATVDSPDPSDPANSSPDSTSGPEMLLPNMRSLDASDIHVEVVGSTRRLRFAASLANLGPGPLLLLPGERAGCPAGQHSARQLLYADRDGDGRFHRARDAVTERRDVGCMLEHPTHDHWHFDAMAAYRLTRPEPGQVLVARNKVSFCLRDNERVPGAPVVVAREHFGDCTREGVQGISPGWVDIYGSDLDGQWLRIPSRVRSATLCLELEADPLDLLAETDESDNERAIAVTIAGSDVRRAPDADHRCSPT